MFDRTSRTHLSPVDDPAHAPGGSRPAADHQRSAYVRAAVDGYGSALGEIVALLAPESVPPSRRPELWEAFDRLERLASAGKTVLSGRAA